MANATISKNLTSPSTASAKMETKPTRQRKLKLFKLYKFIDTTYREIRKYIPGLDTAALNDAAIMECVNNYKKCFSEIYEKEDGFEYFEVCGELAQNISRTLDLFKDITVALTNLDEYYHRVCELLSIFIACELRLSVDSDHDLRLIASRIIYIMKRHLTQEDEEATRYHTLLTLVSVPRLFNAREIVCKIFEEFLPFKSHFEPTALPDKLYIMYIIVFYRWMSMKSLDVDKKSITDMAANFMKPMVSLCNNEVYVPYLPGYTTHRTATRSILCNLKFYQDLRTASIIDNAYKKSGTIVNLCDDDDVVIIDEPQESLSFSVIFAAVQLEPLKSVSSTIVKHEKSIIIDSVDLTVEEESEMTDQAFVKKYEKWLHNYQVMAKQFIESQTRPSQQNESRPNQVISLDSDEASSSENEETISVPVTNPAKPKSPANQTISGKSSGITKQQSKIGEITEDLFDDNYPLTITPIQSTADLEAYEVGDAEDVTKLSRNILPGPLRTYESKKSNVSTTLSMRETSINTKKEERTSNRHRAEKHIRFNFSPLGPTSAYSNESALFSLPIDRSAKCSEIPHIGECTRIPSWSTSLPHQQQEHIAAVPTQFRTIFDRSSSTCGSFLNTSSNNLSSGDLFSSSFSFNGRSATHSLLSPTGGFFDTQQKKRNKIKSLMQRRATLSCRSDFDDYIAAIETAKETRSNNKFQIDSDHKFPQYMEDRALCSEVSNEPEYKSAPASYSSDYDISNRYQFQDEKLKKNCAVVIKPTAEIIQYERKRDAMYNELLMKQRRKMELRAIEKMKEKERRRQEKEMKRDQYLREQKETMEKLEKMKINGPCNTNESNDNESTDMATTSAKAYSLKTKLLEESRMPRGQTEKKNGDPCEYRTNSNGNTTNDIAGKLIITSKTDKSNEPNHQDERHNESVSEKSKNASEKEIEISNNESSEMDLASLRESIKKRSNIKHSKIPAPKQSTGFRKRRQSNLILLLENNPIGTVSGNRTRRRSTSVQSYSEKFLALPNSERIRQSKSGLTDSENQCARLPSCNQGGRQQLSTSKKTKEQTDFPMESEFQRHVEGSNTVRRLTRLQMNPETGHTTDSDIDKAAIPMNRIPRGRGSTKIKKTINVMKSKYMKELHVEECKKIGEGNENEASIVASIAESLCSPIPIVVDKPLASAEREEILNTLEDLLGKESRLPKLDNVAGKSSSILNKSKKSEAESETPPDLQVIENIVIHEIEREMEANADKDKSINFHNQNVQIDKNENTQCERVETLNKAADEQHLQNILDKSLNVLTSLTSTKSNAAEDSFMPIVIPRVESLNTSVERKKAQNPVIEAGQTSIIVTENILLSNGNDYLETQKDDDNSRLLPHLPSSLLTDVETSIIQADISDISPTSINIDITTVEEDTAMAQNSNELSPGVTEVFDSNSNHFIIPTDNMPSNKLTQKEDNNQNIIRTSETEEADITVKNIHSSSKNEGANENRISSPSFESLRVSSDEDGGKLCATAEEHKSNVKTGNDNTLEGDNENLDMVINSPLYEPLRVSSDEEERRKYEMPNRFSKNVNVTNQTPNGIPAEPFKTKASLKLPITKHCAIVLERLSLTSSSIALEDFEKLKLHEMDNDTNVTSVPSPLLNQESSIVHTEDYSDLALSTFANMQSDAYSRESPTCEDYPKIIVESCDNDPEPLPTILKSSSAIQSKAPQQKTVRFNPLAELIPITPTHHYNKKSVFDRDETPPPEDFYRDHDYGVKTSNAKLITAAARKQLYDGCISNINASEELSNSSSSSHDSEDDHDNEVDIVLASAIGEKDLKRKNVYLRRVLLVPPETESSRNVVSLEHSNEETISQAPNSVTNTPLPVYILSNGGNAATSNLSQSSDQERNVLVSTTYLTNVSSSVNPLATNTIQFSMMSPSEHEVTSTQENDSDFLTTAVSLKGTHAENSTLLQNNQVDTTNNSPEIYSSTRNLNENFISKTSNEDNAMQTSDATKDKQEPGPYLSKSNVANANLERISPSTTTAYFYSLTEAVEDNMQNSVLSKTNAKETKKIQHNCSKLKHRNPFILRPLVSNQATLNATETQKERQTSPKPNSCEMQNSKVRTLETDDNPKPNDILQKPPIQNNSKTLPKSTANSLVVANSKNTPNVEIVPRKKIKLIRPKPYTTHIPKISQNQTVSTDTDFGSRLKDIIGKFVPIKPKPRGCQNPSANIQPLSTNSPHASLSVQKVLDKVKRNLNVIDFQESAYSLSGNKGEEVSQVILDKPVGQQVLDTSIMQENQTMTIEHLSGEEKKKLSNDNIDEELVNKNNKVKVKDLANKIKLIKRLRLSSEIEKQPNESQANNEKQKIKSNGIIEFEDPKHKNKTKDNTEKSGAKRKSKRSGSENIETTNKDPKRQDKTSDLKKSKRHNNDKPNESDITETEKPHDKKETPEISKHKTEEDIAAKQNNVEITQESKTNEKVMGKQKNDMKFNNKIEVLQDATVDKKSKDFESAANKKDDQKVKDLKRNATDNDNKSKMESVKKLKLDVKDSQKEKTKKNTTKKLIETDPLEIHDNFKSDTTKRHRVREKKSNKTDLEKQEPHLTGPKQDDKSTKKYSKLKKEKLKVDIVDSNKTKSKPKKNERQERQKNSERHVKTADVETNIKVSTKCSTIVAIKMIPCSKIGKKGNDTCGGDIKTSPNNEIIGVKLIKTANANEGTKSNKMSLTKVDEVERDICSVTNISPNNEIIGVKLIKAANVNEVTRSNKISLTKVDEKEKDKCGVTKISPNNEIIGVKLIKAANVNEVTKSNKISTKYVNNVKCNSKDHTIRKSVNDDLKKNNLSAKTTAKKDKSPEQISSGSNSNTNNSSANQKSIPTEISNPITKVDDPKAKSMNSSSTSTASVHLRKRLKSEI